MTPCSGTNMIYFNWIKEYCLNKKFITWIHFPITSYLKIEKNICKITIVSFVMIKNKLCTIFSFLFFFVSFFFWIRKTWWNERVKQKDIMKEIINQLCIYIFLPKTSILSPIDLSTPNTGFTEYRSGLFVLNLNPIGWEWLFFKWIRDTYPLIDREAGKMRRKKKGGKVRNEIRWEIVVILPEK